MAFLRGLEKAPTFLVPIINPPFADNSPHLFGGGILAPVFFYFLICPVTADSMGGPSG